MTHPADKLYAYLLGELGPEETATLETHLESCETCQTELARLTDPLVALTEALPQQAPPERVWNGLETKFSALKQQPGNVTALPARPAPRPYYRFLIAACIAALALATGSSYWGFQNYQDLQAVRANNRLVAERLAQPQVQRVVLENVLNSTRTSSPGSVLLSEDSAMFVLASAAPADKTYQAWGHASSDWNADMGEELSSLGVSSSNVIEVKTAGFASLYLSLEPPGGSPQPTQPLSKVSLLAARPDTPLAITSPQTGEDLLGNSVLLSGTVAPGWGDLAYQLNGGETVPITAAENRFNVTVIGLAAGKNKVEVSATDARGEQVSSSVTVYAP